MIISIYIGSTHAIEVFLKRVGLVQSDSIIIFLKINLFSPWYSWKIAELVLNNNHSLTPTFYIFSHAFNAFFAFPTMQGSFKMYSCQILRNCEYILGYYMSNM
jgi:hypothetical protein